jgi:hypothetical protein
MTAGIRSAALTIVAEEQGTAHDTVLERPLGPRFAQPGLRGRERLRLVGLLYPRPIQTGISVRTEAAV